MPTEPRPSWLAIQEHGVLAEARTRAFLLDRFWVLERSVDIEGADFIIQPRLTNRSLLDPNSPCLGFVQAKFYSSIRTTQYIHKEYVIDCNGSPRAEFFLICHSGNEDSRHFYLLSAADIKTHFRETAAEQSRPGRFALPGKDVLIQRFEVIDCAHTLNRIDKALHDADFNKNRYFLSWALPRYEDSLTPILPMYEEPIDNWWGDIPKQFSRIRKRATSARWDLEGVIKKLREMEESPDPERVLALAEDLWHEYHDHVSLPPDLWDEDFFTVVEYHKKRFNQLSEAGLLGAHAAMRQTVVRQMIQDIAPRMPMALDAVYLLRVRYDPSTFLRVHYESRFEKVHVLWPTRPPNANWSFYKDIPDTKGLFVSSPGDIELYILPGRYPYEHIETDEPWEEKIVQVVEKAIGILLEAVLDYRFGE